jgi:nitrous oxidase accessory protein
MRASRLLPALILASAGTVEAQRTIEVRPGRPPTIAEAVRQAHPGDRIVIRKGVYREPTIVIDRPLVLQGELGAVLDGARATDIVRIQANHVTIRALAFRNVVPSHVEDRAAIRIGAVANCLVENNRIENAFFGIYLSGTDGCRLARNVVAGGARSEGSAGNGVHLWTARNIEIANNRITGHRDGIYLEFAHDTRVTGNRSERNVRYGLHFMYSDDCTYERNTFTANQAGVAVMYSKRVMMVENVFEDNWGPSAFGLLLKEIYDSRLEGNRFLRNTTALFADGATRMTATRNVFADNGWAVKLVASTQNAEFTANSFVGNTFDVSTNSVGSSNILRGNYWDAYEGYDLDRDGRGDVAHRPVRLFSLIVERNEPTLILLRSPMIALLDRAERLLPSLTPETLLDPAPLMRRPR